jgi:Secretion system C-terminal sorting domain
MRILFILCATLAGLPALLAQPVLQNNVFPAIGSTFTSVAATSTALTSGPAGANQNWDFTQLMAQSLGNGSTQFLAAAGTPYAAQFPAANVASVINASLTLPYSYYQIQNNEVNFWGSILKNDTTEVSVKLTDPEIKLRAPMNFNAMFSDTYAGTSSVLTNGTTITTMSKGNKTVLYDAYGTLRMPNQVYQNAMRLKTTALTRDSSAFLGLGYSITALTTTTYEWYVANQPGPLLVIFESSGTATSSIPGLPPLTTPIVLTRSITFRTNTPTSSLFDVGDQPPAFRIASVWPNPTVDQLNIAFELADQRSNYQLLLLDTQGRAIRTQPIANGQSFLSLPVQDLVAGAYSLRLTDGKQSYSVSFLKQ